MLRHPVSWQRYEIRIHLLVFGHKSRFFTVGLKRGPAMVKLMNHLCFHQWYPDITIGAYPIALFEPSPQRIELLPSSE